MSFQPTSADDNTMTEQPFLSLVVVTYNRGDALREALESLLAMPKYPDYDFEIVVIDNGSTDHTPSVVQNAAINAPYKVRYFFEPKPGIACARNRGVRESEGDWLAFFDDDQLAPSDWLVHLVRACRSEDLRYAGGGYVLKYVQPNPPPLDVFSRQMLGEFVVSTPTHYHYHFLPATGNVVIDKSLFASFGEFDESMHQSGEDTEWFTRLVLAKIPGRHVPESHILHVIPPHRTDRNYIEYVARRSGIILAYRDRKYRGIPMTRYLSLLRLLRSFTLCTLQRTVAKLTRNQAMEVGTTGKMKRDLAYIWTAWGNEASIQKLASQNAHRGK